MHRQSRIEEVGEPNPTSFGYETSLHYDAEDTRGDEEETVEFLARIADGRDAGVAIEAINRVRLDRYLVNPVTPAGERLYPDLDDLIAAGSVKTTW